MGCLQESIVYQFHSMEILHASGPILIPPMLFAVFVAAKEAAEVALDIVGKDMVIDETAVVAMFMFTSMIFNWWC
jgi:hypothetical protein